MEECLDTSIQLACVVGDNMRLRVSDVDDSVVGEDPQLLERGCLLTAADLLAFSRSRSKTTMEGRVRESARSVNGQSRRLSGSGTFGRGR